MSVPEAPRIGSASYRRAEEFLLGLVNYEVKPPPMRSDEAGWHLREFSAMLDALGHPECAAPIVHVAGTKGKGSTVRLVQAILSEHGMRVGSFLSPHIDYFRERIHVDGRAVSEKDFTRALDAVRRHCAVGSPEGFRTTFEVLTAMAFWTFRQCRCDCVVLETGLGGRLDATNVAPSVVAAITAIGYDHQRVLGNTLAQIAREKAGIVKNGVRVAVVGPQAPRRRAIVRRTVDDAARRAKVPVRYCDEETDPVLNARPTPGGFLVDLRNGPSGVSFPVLGRHQLRNLATALAAAHEFLRIENRDLDNEALARAMRTFRSPGRMERICDAPTVLLDSAHCPLSARATSQTCAEHFPGRPVVLILGLLGDKRAADILNSLRQDIEVAGALIYRPSTPRARAAEATARIAARLLGKSQVCGSTDEAVCRALEIAGELHNPVVLATGTFYGLGPVRRAIEALLPPSATRLGLGGRDDF